VLAEIQRRNKMVAGKERRICWMGQAVPSPSGNRRCMHVL